MSEAVAHRLSDGDVVGVATAVVPVVCRPELAELCAAMQPVPVEADDIGRWLVRERWSSQLLDDVELFRWASSEDMNTAATPIGRLRKLVSQPVGVPPRVAEHEVVGNRVSDFNSPGQLRFNREIGRRKPLCNARYQRGRRMSRSTASTSIRLSACFSLVQPWLRKFRGLSKQGSEQAVHTVGIVRSLTLASESVDSTIDCPVIGAFYSST